MLINLFAVFNERDPERRAKAIADNYTEDVIWTDPEGTTRGHEAMNPLRTQGEAGFARQPSQSLGQVRRLRAWAMRSSRRTVSLMRAGSITVTAQRARQTLATRIAIVPT
jgi:hypothetical protein